MLERLRYVPLGWSRALEFGESDVSGALATLDEWLTTAAGQREHIAPDRIPFAALRALFGSSIYGGRVQNVFDQRLLDALLNHCFTPRCFDADFYLVWRTPVAVNVVVDLCVCL